MKKKAAVILLLICVVGAGAVAAGRMIPAATFSDAADGGNASEKLVYVHYAGTYLSLDQNETVCANNSECPSGIPEITGVEFINLAFGEKADPEESSALDYVIKVALCLNKHGIRADQIHYDSRMVDVMIGKLKICLGKNDKTEDKISDLSNFIDKLEGADGTLYMQNGNANNYGYTFRANKS